MNLYLNDRISTAIDELKTSTNLSSNDRIRRAALIEAYLFVLGYFEEPQKLSDVSLKKESYTDTMVRHGNLFLESKK